MVPEIPIGTAPPDAKKELCHINALYRTCSMMPIEVINYFPTYGFELELYFLIFNCSNLKVKHKQPLYIIAWKGFKFTLSFDTSISEEHYILEIISHPVYRAYAKECLAVLYELKNIFYQQLIAKLERHQKNEKILLSTFIRNAAQQGGLGFTYSISPSLVDEIEIDVEEYRRFSKRKDSLCHCQINAAVVFGNQCVDFNMAMSKTQTAVRHEYALNVMTPAKFNWYSYSGKFDDLRRKAMALWQTYNIAPELKEKNKIQWFLLMLAHQELSSEMYNIHHNNLFRPTIYPTLPELAIEANIKSDYSINVIHYGGKDFFPILLKSGTPFFTRIKKVLDGNCDERLNKKLTGAAEKELDMEEFIDLQNGMILEFRNVLCGHEIPDIIIKQGNHWINGKLQVTGRFQLRAQRQPETIEKILNGLID